MNTFLPKDITQILASDLEQFLPNAQEARVNVSGTDREGIVKNETRLTEIAWVPASHWSAGFLMHYAHLVNNDNYLYDITGIDNNHLQYGVYGVGGHYVWHADQDMQSMEKHPNCFKHGLHEDRAKGVQGASSELVRKISFSLQLTDPSEYEGGELQVMLPSGEIHTMPKELGTVIFFDSRLTHRVTPVTKGERRSMVGWVVGPRWR